MLQIFAMAAKRELSTIPADKLALYEKLLATNPTIKRKGANVPYTSANGYMFTYLSEEGVLRIRLPKDALDDFMRKYDASLAVAYGVVQKDFVEVPDSLLKKTKELKKYLDRSYEYVMNMKPKPGKKK